MLPMTREEQQVAGFFASLANSHSRWPILTEEEKAVLIRESQEFLTQCGPKGVLERFRQLENSDGGRKFIFLWLEDIAQTVGSDLPALFAGQSVRLPENFAPFGWLKGRNIVVGVQPTGESDEFLESRPELVQIGITQFYRLFEQRPFPLGQCQVCHKVFVQSNTGKPRRYCSPQCAAKSRPSRAAEMRKYRQTVREQELRVCPKT